MNEKEELSVVRPELLQIAEAVARDKSIEQTIVIEALEQAIQSVAKKKYGQDLEVKASIDEKTGEIKINRVLHIVNEIENSSNQISLDQGKEYDKNAKMGDTILDPLPPIDFGRVAAQTAKQVIVQRVKEADKEEIIETVSNSVTTVQEVLGDMMGDAPACPDCGHITIRNGSCYKCLNCGNSLGCS